MDRGPLLSYGSLEYPTLIHPRSGPVQRPVLDCRCYRDYSSTIAVSAAVLPASMAVRLLWHRNVMQRRDVAAHGSSVSSPAGRSVCCISIRIHTIDSAVFMPKPSRRDARRAVLHMSKRQTPSMRAAVPVQTPLQT